MYTVVVKCEMKSLHHLCENCLVNLLIKTLECRKKKITKWIISIDEWITQLNIQDIKVCIIECDMQKKC